MYPPALGPSPLNIPTSIRASTLYRLRSNIPDEKRAIFVGVEILCLGKVGDTRRVGNLNRLVKL